MESKKQSMKARRKIRKPRKQEGNDVAFFFRKQESKKEMPKAPEGVEPSPARSGAARWAVGFSKASKTLPGTLTKESGATRRQPERHNEMTLDVWRGS